MRRGGVAGAETEMQTVQCVRGMLVVLMAFSFCFSVGDMSVE